MQSSEQTREDLLGIATEVHVALEDLTKSRAQAVLRVERILDGCGASSDVTFPSQWCDFATAVFGTYLCRETGDAAITLVIGENPGKLSRHWWLEYGGLSLDITCDQFRDGPSAPFVDVKTPWHDQRFEEVSRRNFFARPLQAAYFERAVVGLAFAIEQEETIRERKALRALHNPAMQADAAPRRT